MQKYIASGNIVKEIELKKTTNGKLVISNTIAIKKDYKNADGKYESDFFNIVVWGNEAEFVSKYANKGDKILIEGKLATRNYDKADGTKVYVTEIVCEKVELLSGKKQEVKAEEVEVPSNYKSQYQANDITLNDEDIDKAFTINDNSLPF